MGGKAGALLALGRVSNLPTCVSNATAGFCLGGGDFLASPFRWAAAVLATACFYEAGMVLNDLCDRDADRRERPGRPIPSGRVTPREAGWIAAVLAAAGLFAAAAVFPRGLAAAGALLVLVPAYDLLHKRVPFAPAIMGGCRGAVYLLAAAAGGDPRASEAWIAAAGLALHVSAATSVARDEVLASVTRRQKGWACATAGALVFPFLVAGDAFPSPVAAAAFLAAAAWTARTIAAFVPGRAGAGTTVGRMIAGIGLLDGLFLAARGCDAGAFLAWGCFLATVAGHRRIRGT